MYVPMDITEPESAFRYPYSGVGYEDSSYGEEGVYTLRRPVYPSLEEKPAKKAKTGNVGGGIISRFLNSATAGYERRGGRLAAVGA